MASNKQKKIVKVDNSAKLPTLPLEDLQKNFESNNLKDKKKRDVADLKKSILKLGFKIPLVIWVEGKYITDGAGRLKALELLEYEGYEIPEIPFIPVQAKNKREAKQLTLAISSQYGEVTDQSFGDFTLDMHEIDLSFVNLRGIDMENIKWSPEPLKKEKKKREKGKTVMMHTCPECGHEFN